MQPKPNGAGPIPAKCPEPDGAGSNPIPPRAVTRAADIGSVSATARAGSPGSPEVWQFLAALRKGVEAWREAAQLLVRGINRDPAFREQILTAEPTLSRRALDSLERVGRGSLLPELLTQEHRPGIRRMMQMSIEDQRRYIAEPVEIVRGETSAHVFVRDLKSTEIAQVFAGLKLRSPREQRQWLRDHSDNPRWLVIGNHIRIWAGTYTARDLERMLRDLSKP